MSLKIALLGYGNMGQAVEAAALARGHEVCLRANRENFHAATLLGPADCDCIIEFTRPESAMANFRTLLPNGIPIVTGTTGWLSQRDTLQAEVAAIGGTFLHSSNFSVGVNVLFKLNAMLAKIMNGYPEYDCFVEEAHHRHKKDAPSGTALHLSQQIIEHLDRKDHITDEALRHRAPDADELSVAHTRAGEIVGTHRVSYISAIDEITIAHQAYNRRGFALGAVIAAEWIQGRKGFFEFSQVFDQY